jgi:hypothetical protein
MSKVKPINPNEIASKKVEEIPDEVIATFNKLIAMKFSQGSALIKQEDIMISLQEQGFKREEIFHNGWLNIEEIYEDAGWEVHYDKPAYNESYPASFTFSKRGKQG